MFDDLEDRDAKTALWRKHGQAQALNAATALLMLAYGAVARLRLKGVDDFTIARATETIASLGATACAGQHYDLAWESKPFVSESQYFKMIEMKSGSLMECACRMGAVVAGADEKTVDSYGLFGRNLGMAAQIMNDTESTQDRQSAKSDLIKRKKTLPVIFAFSHAEPEDRKWLTDLYGQDIPMEPREEQRVSQILQRCGAIHYSVIRAELYKQKAIQSLKAVSDSIRQTLQAVLSI